MAIVSKTTGYRDPHIPTKPRATKVHHNPSLATIRGLIGRTRFVGAEYWPTPGEAPYNISGPTNLFVAEPVVGDVVTLAHVGAGTWGGDPAPTLTYELTVDGVVKTMPYTILAANIGAQFQFREIATNAYGSENETTAGSLPIVGPELYVDGGMSSTAGITATNTTLAIVSGQLQMTTTIAGGDTSSSRFLSGLTTGKSFRARATMKRGTVTNVNLIAYNGTVGYLAQGPLITATTDTATEINFTLTGGITSFTLYSQMVGTAISQTGFVDNISVRQTSA